MKPRRYRPNVGNEGASLDVRPTVVRTSDEAIAGRGGLVRAAGGPYTTTTPASEPPRGGWTIGMFVRGAAGQLAANVARKNDGTVRVDIGDRSPLSEAALVHERSAAGWLRGKILLIPPS